MIKMVAPKLTDNIANAVSHCLHIKPYNMLVFDRINGNKTPVYFVGGVNGGPWAAQTALKKAYEQHGGHCHYCKKPIKNGEFSIDHVEAKAKGGSDSLQNLVIAHKVCNVAKGQMLIEAYNPAAGREWLSALLAQVQSRLNQIPQTGF
jgi:5-methylcytosine-specific restriction endonuclease McrA